MDEVLIRTMRPEDVPLAEQLSDEVFFDLDTRVTRSGYPPPQRRTPEHARSWVARSRHLVEHDAGGCWVAEHDGAMVGFATSLCREGLWILATYAVLTGWQGKGLGKQLLDAASTHGQDGDRGMLSASSDPKALRRYVLAGFAMHPQMSLEGTVDRSAIPTVRGVREGDATDVGLLDELDRRARGAGHGPDHAILLADNRLIVVEHSGYAYVDHLGRVVLLAADDESSARALLWTVLAEAVGETSVRHVTAANPWAIDVGVRARLDLHQEGYLALRGMAPPTCYLHNGALL